MLALDAHIVTKSPRMPQLLRLSREYRTRTLHPLLNHILRKGLSPKEVRRKEQQTALRLPKTEADLRTNNKEVRREHAANRKQNE